MTWTGGVSVCWEYDGRRNISGRFTTGVDYNFL